jgi:mannitol-specific phosphotransferase system IIBC component
MSAGRCCCASLIHARLWRFSRCLCSMVRGLTGRGRGVSSVGRGNTGGFGVVVGIVFTTALRCPSPPILYALPGMLRCAGYATVYGTRGGLVGSVRRAIAVRYS